MTNNPAASLSEKPEERTTGKIRTFTEFTAVWSNLTESEKSAVRDKAGWEHMSLWAVLNEWPSLIPERCLPIIPLTTTDKRLGPEASDVR